ncbi:hypothetical protein [Halomonas organivorans]|uniref:Uncharacterized protein n=1 Tax=Halomonas organivorans TaxID=257772 RepID=A0A7W5C1U8_9GAMM|nr:hypothetical protein [Halomonas organivorans]MBB3143306.1 hypothetical protein [Halomonas organivorans]
MDATTLAFGLAIIALLASLASLAVLVRLRGVRTSAPKRERLGVKALREPPESVEPQAPRKRRSRLPPSLVARLMAAARRR